VFTLAEDAIKQNLLPKVSHKGIEIPGIGFGTFGSDHASPKMVANAMKEALSLGFRHIDCAAVYGNEKEIGATLTEIFDSGVIKREEVWITSKVWNNMHDRIQDACSQSLKNLQLGYLDLYLVHWPFPNHHEPGVDVHARSAESGPFLIENFMNTWKQMENLVELGLVRQIGVSNMTVPKLEIMLRHPELKIKPFCHQMELHPHFQQHELFAFVNYQEILPVGYSPLGSPHRPERDKTPEDSVDLDDPVIIKIAQSHNLHPAQIALKWAAQNGHIPIPFSTNRKHIRSNLECLTKPPLTNAEMIELKKIDANCRLIKGQVFLWKKGQSWEDLWDINGEITPP